MKKILLIGEYYSTNLGDPVLCQTVKRNIEINFPNAEVIPVDLSGKISYEEYYEPTRYSLFLKNFIRASYRLPFILGKSAFYRVYKNNEKRHIRIFSLIDKILDNNKVDLAVFAGGALFMDYFPGAIYYIVKKLMLKNIKVIFHACGMGKLSKDSVILLKRVLSYKNIVSISLRDSYDNFMQLFKCKKDVFQTYDTALMCSEYFKPSDLKIAEYGIGVIALPEFYQFQKDLINKFLLSEKSWRIFTNGSPADYEFAIRILTDLGVERDLLQSYIANRPTCAEELVQTVTSFKKILSFRMHSLIISMAFGIPNVGFVWDDKVTELYQKIGMQMNCEYPSGIIDLADFDIKLNYNAIDLSKIVYEAGHKSKDLLISMISSVRI